MDDFIIALILISFALIAVLAYFFYRKALQLERELNQLAFDKSSQSVKYGRISEQWIPLSEKFPFEKEKFKFLGQPIDGIVFGDDSIIFCEFKSTDTAQLNESQKKVKELVKQKKIEWFEMKTS